MKELLNYVCSQLDQHQIPYMISGSVAMSVYTVPRFTRDIDLVVVLQEQDAATYSQNSSGYKNTKVDNKK